MVVSKCPICNEFLVGYAWTKTAKGKNWLSHPQKGWHDCPNKKMVKKTAGKSRKITGFSPSPEDGFDSDETGFYCTKGHKLPYEYSGDACPKCGDTITTKWYRVKGVNT